MENVKFLLDCVADGKLSKEQAKDLLEDGKKLQVIPHGATAPFIQPRQPPTSATSIGNEGM